MISYVIIEFLLLIMSVCVSVFPVDVQQLLVIKEEVSHECEWSPSVNHPDSELWKNQERVHCNGLEEDIKRFPCTVVHVKMKKRSLSH